MDSQARDSRRGAVVAALACAWTVAIALIYFWPTAGHGARAVLDGSLPDLALTREPARRLGSLAAAALILLAAWGYGATLLGLHRRGRRLTPDARDPLEAFLTAVGLGAGVLSLIALALSPLGLLRSGALIAVAAVGAVLAATRLPRGSWTRPRVPAGTFERATWGLLAAAGVVALVGALAPEVEYDAIWYHLNLPKRYLAAGSLLDFPCQYVAHYPMGTELLFGYGLAIGDQVAAKLVHFGFGILLVLGTYHLAMQVVSRRAALLAAAILALTPTVTWEATTAYVELATAFFVVLALSWVIRYAQDGSRGALLVGALFAGFALATKTLALIAAAPLAALVLLVTRGAALRRLGAAGVFLAVALVPAFPWYLRAQVETGNPVFPSAYGVFGANPELWNAQADAGQRAFFDRFGFRHGTGSFLALPWDVTMHAAAFGGCVGVAYLILLPFALRRRPSRALALTALFCLGYLALWASPLSSLQLRFLVPVLGPLAVLAAAGFERMWSLARAAAPAWAAVLSAVVLLVLALALPPFRVLHERDGKDTLTHVMLETPLDVVTGAESEDAYVTRRVPAYPAIQRLNRLAGPDDLVVVAIDPFADFYARPAMAPDYAVCLSNAGLRAGSAVAAHRALIRTSVDYVLADERVRAAWSFDWVARDFRRGALTPVYSAGSLRLYRVRRVWASHATPRRQSRAPLRRP
jgi:hypothetical protein